MLLREALDNSDVTGALEDNLVDARQPLRIRHSLASQLRTLMLQRAMGWIDLSDTEPPPPLEGTNDLLLHAFFLVTILSKFDWPLEKVLALNRKRDSAEARMGEVKSALDVHLLSTDRGASEVQDVMARNDVSLLLSLYAYQVLHGLRRLLENRALQG